MIGERATNRQERVTHAGTDYVLVVVVAALVILGLMMVYSSTFDMAYLEYDNPNYFFHRQLIWLVLSIIIMIVIARVNLAK